MKCIKLLGCVAGCGIIGAILVSIVVGIYQKPIQIELPSEVPLVLEFNTGLTIDQTRKLLCSKYSVSNDEISVELMRNERMMWKRIPLAHMLKVTAIDIPGLSCKELRCFFLRDRLMEVQFKPQLTEEECGRLSLDFTSFETPATKAGKREVGYFEGSCAGQDRLQLIDYVWGSGVRSELLWKAYHQLTYPRHCSDL